MSKIIPEILAGEIKNKQRSLHHTGDPVEETRSL